MTGVIGGLITLIVAVAFGLDWWSCTAAVFLAVCVVGVVHLEHIARALRERND